MIDFNEFSNEVFQILRAYGKDIVLYDADGKRVFEPYDARRMYVVGDNILVSILEDGDNSSLRLYLSPSLNLNQVSGFLETLRRLVTQSNLIFHVKKYNKEIKPKDFATQASVNEGIQMNIMEGLYGTSKSSYLKLENARMIVRHSAKIREHVIGDRGRHIHSIFVENAQGERFLFPVNMLSGARAMAQHVNNGGNFADEVSSQIIRMAQDFKNLAQVTTHIQGELSEAAKSTTGPKVEAYGVKGMKSTKWRKIFKNSDAMCKWCDANDAEVQGQSNVDAPNTPVDESLLKLRTAVYEQMQANKRSFSRICHDATYVRESAHIISSASLMESTESLEESIAALTVLLGENCNAEAIACVARIIPLSALTANAMVEDIGTDTAGVGDASDDDELSEDFEPSVQVGDAIIVTAAGKYLNKTGTIITVPSDVDTELFTIEIDGVHRQAKVTSFKLATNEMEINLTIDGQPESELANNKSFKEFDSWAESFDPETMFGQTQVKENDNMTQQYEVYGTIGLSNKFRKKFNTELEREEWIENHGHKVNIIGTKDPEEMVSSEPALSEKVAVFATSSDVAGRTRPVDSGKTGNADRRSQHASAVRSIRGDNKSSNPGVYGAKSAMSTKTWVDHNYDETDFDQDEVDEARKITSITPDYNKMYYNKDEWMTDAEKFGFTVEFGSYGSVAAFNFNNDKVGSYRGNFDTSNGDVEQGHFYRAHVTESQSPAQKAAFAKMLAAKKGSTSKKTDSSPKSKDKEAKTDDESKVDETFRIGSTGYRQAARIASSNITRDATEKMKAKDAKLKADKAFAATKARKEGRDIDESSTVMSEAQSPAQKAAFAKMLAAKKPAKKDNACDKKADLAEATSETKTYVVTQTKEKTGKTTKQEGTLAELIDAYDYTLETGASYSSEEGNSKIDRNPKTIASLIKNLNNAVNNAAANGDSGVTFDYKLIKVTDTKKIKESSISGDSYARRIRHDNMSSTLYGVPEVKPYHDDTVSMSDTLDESSGPSLSLQTTVSTPEEDDISVEVTFTYSPGHPHTYYQPNGDPGDEGDMAQVVLLSIVCADTGEDILEYLSDDELDMVEKTCHVAGENNTGRAPGENKLDVYLANKDLYDDEDMSITDESFDSTIPLTFSTTVSTSDEDDIDVDVVCSYSHEQVYITSIIRTDTGEDIQDLLLSSELDSIEQQCHDAGMSHAKETNDDNSIDRYLGDNDLYDDEDLSMDDDIEEDGPLIPRDQSASFKDEVETDGHDSDKQSTTYIARLRALAGLK